MTRLNELMAELVLICPHPVAQINAAHESPHHVCTRCGKPLTDKDLDDRDEAARVVGEAPWLNDTWSRNADR